jgi:hypothetical protein
MGSKRVNKQSVCLTIATTELKLVYCRGTEVIHWLRHAVYRFRLPLPPPSGACNTSRPPLEPVLDEKCYIQILDNVEQARNPMWSLSATTSPHICRIYEGVSKSSRTESITKYMLTTINTRWEATKRVMAAKLTRPTHKTAIQLHLEAEGSTICSSRPRRPVRKLLDTSS